MMIRSVIIMSIKELIIKRRSYNQFTDEKIDADEIIELLNIAVYAPNHKMREPWRFILLYDEGKQLFLNRYIHALSETEKDLQKKTLDKVFIAPMIVAFVMPHQKDMKDELEDLQANAALIQNFLLLLEDQNYAGFWKTPAYIESDTFKDILGLTTQEMIVALVMVGKPKGQASYKPRKDAKSKTTIYS